MTTDDEATARRCLRGLSEARQRLDFREGVDEEGAVIALTEAVVWVVMLHDALHRPPSDLLDALRFARNKGVHEFAAVLEDMEGRRYPQQYPRRYRSIVWRPVEEVAATGFGRQPYAELLAGRQVWPTLADAEELLRAAVDWNEPER